MELVLYLHGGEELCGRDGLAGENLFLGDDTLLDGLLGKTRTAVVEGLVDLERFLLAARELHLLLVGRQGLFRTLEIVDRILWNLTEPRNAIDICGRKGLGVVGLPVPVADNLYRGLVAAFRTGVTEDEALHRGVVAALADEAGAARVRLSTLPLALLAERIERAAG